HLAQLRRTLAPAAQDLLALVVRLPAIAVGVGRQALERACEQRERIGVAGVVARIQPGRDEGATGGGAIAGLEQVIGEARVVGARRRAVDRGATPRRPRSSSAPRSPRRA